MSTAVVSFGEWLPDQPEFGNPGLIVAKNVVPSTEGYRPYRPLDNSMATMPATPDSGYFAHDTGSTHVLYVWSNSAGAVYVAPALTNFTTRGSMNNGFVGFAQYENLVIMSNTGGVPYMHTINSASAITVLSAATLPPARCVGVVGQFVVLGGLQGATSSVRWSGIDAPTSWPVPNSATATAQQAGQQDLHTDCGDVQAVHGGDQYAIILQRGGVTRMTYVGPPAVFQFDSIDDSYGSYFPRGSCKVGRLVYFISNEGICRTDGVSVEKIGQGKVDRTFWSAVDLLSNEYSVHMTHEQSTDLIYVSYATAAASTIGDTLLIYDPASNRFSYANQNTELLVSPRTEFATQNDLLGFSTTNILGRMRATAGSATFVTGEIEINPGGRSFVTGVKPHVESSGTAPAVTVRVGSRSDLTSAPTYTATTTPTTRTGFADCRVDAKYHRAEVQIVGTFNKATGVEFNAVPTGKA